MDYIYKYPYAPYNNDKVSILALAKQILCKRLNERQKPFKIGIYSNRYCTEADRCKKDKQYCNNIPQKYDEFNLHDYYDQPIALLGEDSPYDFLISSSNPRRRNIYVVFSTNVQPFIAPKGSQDQIMEIRIKDTSDLRLLETCEVFKQGLLVKLYHFKDRPIKPEMLYLELKQLGKKTPPCKSEKGHSSLKRYVLYPDGTFNCFELSECQAKVHDEKSLMDITYNTYYFKGFDPGKELARKDWRARFCDYCEHCLTSIRNTTWCELNLNGTTRYNSFIRTKGPKCPEFIWRSLTAAVDLIGEDVKPKRGIDYFIWKNPVFKK